MSDTVTIEPARADDAPAVEAMIDAAYGKYVAWSGQLPARVYLRKALA